MTFKLMTDPERCQGHGKCVIDCPDVFDTDDQGYVMVRVHDVPDALRPAVARAVDDCPEGALRIEA